LAEERLTKASLEQRGITVITTAGTIVGLLFGLVAVITQATEFALPAGARPWLTWSLISLTASTLGGLLVNFPTTYEEADPASLREFVLTDEDTWAPDWEESDFEGSRQVAELNVRLLEVARTVNAFKAKLLFGAQLMEIIGIGLLAIAVLFVTQIGGN
jgi:type III secretory pathway component EscS